MSNQLPVDRYLELLWWKHHERKFIVLCGDAFGDNGKGCVEAAIMPFHEACVRVSGGANTGRTAGVVLPDGSTKLIVFHLVPTGWASKKTSVIGDWVLLDPERLAKEIQEVETAVGSMPAPLYISKRAPVLLPYHILLEQWIEMAKGSRTAGPTGRGISPMLAGVDLRLAPLAGHMLHPDLFNAYVKDFYKSFEPIFRKMARAGLVRLKDLRPALVTEQVLAKSHSFMPMIVDTDPILLDLAKKNSPTLFGLTQGHGLHFKGTYPFNSATQTIASAAAYCAGLPMSAFGPVIMAAKVFPTRVGAGPFPTGLWDRQAALEFPKLRPELFSCLPEYQPDARATFLAELRAQINAGNYVNRQLAQYIMVLGNELGASTGRGREVGYPDLHLTAIAGRVNGADSLFLTRIDLLSGLKLRLPVGIGYKKMIPDDDSPNLPIDPNVLPMPAEILADEYEAIRDDVSLDLEHVDLSGVSDEAQLPDDFMQLVRLFERRTGLLVSLSSSAGLNGKIFRL